MKNIKNIIVGVVGLVFISLIIGATNRPISNLSGEIPLTALAQAVQPASTMLTNLSNANGSGLTNLSASALPATNLWPSLHLPAEVTAVVGDELQLFTRGVAQANDPYTWPLQWVANVGYPYPRYWDFTRYLDVASQFDSEYNMPTSTTAVNTRNSTTELRGSNGVHPDTSGYYQIGDVVYRDIIRTFCQ